MLNRILLMLVVVQFLIIGFFAYYFNYQINSKTNLQVGNSEIMNNEIRLNSVYDGKNSFLSPESFQITTENKIYREGNNKNMVEPYTQFNVDSRGIYFVSVGYDSTGVQYRSVRKIRYDNDDVFELYIDTTKRFSQGSWDSQGRFNNFKIPSNAYVEYVSEIN